MNRLAPKRSRSRSRWTLFAPILLLPLAGCASTPSAQRLPADDPNAPAATLPELKIGGRHGLHGMVIFGRAGRYFVDHIPMLEPPHDLQMIAEIKLTNHDGKPVTADLLDQAYTLRPSENFSLNDWVAGRRKSFMGSIFVGGFEQGGKLLKGHSQVQVDLVGVSAARDLPAESAREVFDIRIDADTLVRANVITPARNVQKIWVEKPAARALWCVQGPDFFSPCEK